MKKEVEVLRIVRIPPLGKLVMQVGEQRYEHFNEITDEKIKQVVLAAIGELVGLVGGYQVLTNAGVAPDLTPAAPPPAEQPLTPEQARFMAQLEAERDALQTALRQKTGQPIIDLEDLVDEPVKQPKEEAERPLVPPTPTPAQEAPQPKPQPTPPPPAKPTKDRAQIVQQVDAILQQHLSNNPEFVGRSIHIIQNPAGGVGIDVDGAIYRKPQEIEDQAVQALIKQSLKEWESS